MDSSLRRGRGVPSAVSAAAVAAIVLALLFGAATAKAANRFEGRVEGVGSGTGHSFIIGDGLYLSFKDRRAGDTRYHVCWRRHGHHSHRCNSGRTGRRGKWDKLYTAAPPKQGNYTVKWFVNKHSVAR